MLQPKDQPQPLSTAGGDALELSILMPCLNEAETLAACIRKARGFLASSNVRGEVIVADNGSTDGSREIAAREGARVVAVETRGYGAAIQGGVAAARGRFVIMGDADDSYDFSALQPFLEELRAGADLVMGNRFRGGIAPGAMPLLHRYVGNPALSFIGRQFFSIGVGDFHCGLRGFNRDRLALLPALTLLALIGIVLAAAWPRRFRFSPLPLAALAVVCAAAVASRVALLAYLDVTAIPAVNGLYLSPVTPLFLLFVVLGVYLAGQFALGALRGRKAVPPEAT